MYPYIYLFVPTRGSGCIQSWRVTRNIGGMSQKYMPGEGFPPSISIYVSTHLPVRSDESELTYPKLEASSSRAQREPLACITYEWRENSCVDIYTSNPSYHTTQTTQTQRITQESSRRQRRQRVASRPKVASKEKARPPPVSGGSSP